MQQQQQQQLTQNYTQTTTFTNNKTISNQMIQRKAELNVATTSNNKHADMMIKCVANQKHQTLVATTNSPPTTPQSSACRPSFVLPQTNNQQVTATQRSQSRNSFPSQSTANSMLFDFRGKDVRPSVSLKPRLFNATPNTIEHLQDIEAEELADIVAAHTNNNINLTNNNNNNQPISTRRGGASSQASDLYDELMFDSNCLLNAGTNDNNCSEITYIGPDGSSCCVQFENDNVIVNNGSLLVRRNKQLKLSFHQTIEAVFEYPSESSMLAIGSDSSTPIENNRPIPDTAIRLESPSSESSLLLSTPAIPQSRCQKTGPSTKTVTGK